MLLLPLWLPLIVVLMRNTQSLIVSNSQLFITRTDYLTILHKMCNRLIYII